MLTRSCLAAVAVAAVQTENAALKDRVDSLQNAIGQLQAYISSMGAPVQGAAGMACY
jgi:uncharacterized protein YukE